MICADNRQEVVKHQTFVESELQRPVSRLLKVASSQLAPASFPRLERYHAAVSERLTTELSVLLSQRNGFFAFESALHVYSDVTTDRGIGLFDWNSPPRWIDAYGGLADGMLFFAQDVFGGQFCLRRDEICTFDPETGSTDCIADSFEAWARVILDDYEVLAGFPLAHAWQTTNGALPPGQRLVPKTPFVLGGEYTVKNLYALDATEAMTFRANLAVQIRDLTEGAQVKWEIRE